MMAKQQRPKAEFTAPLKSIDSVPVPDVPEQPDPESNGKPAPTPRFEPRACSLCEAVRKRKGDEEGHVRVYTTRHVGGRIIRYCRCDYCGNTFKDVSKA